MIPVTVIDSDSEDAIANAAFYLVDGNGNTTELLGTANDQGVFSIPAPPFGQKVQVDYTGYTPQVIDPAYMSPYARIKLVADASGSLGGVVIKSIRKLKKQNYAVPIVLGSAAVITFGIWLYRKYA